MEVCTHKRKIKKLQILKQECRSAKKLARLLAVWLYIINTMDDDCEQVWASHSVYNSWSCQWRYDSNAWFTTAVV